MTSPRPILIDCDPGVDDAVMLIMALASAEQLDVRAITTVAGNVPLHLTSRNARMLRQLTGREDVPVYAGCGEPMLREPVTAEDFHGESGIAGLAPFEPDAPLAEAHAVDAIIDAIAASPTPLTLVVTGPMTNIALAWLKAPEVLATVREIVAMAGADTEGGNITPFAEFNVFADPHAAAIVCKSGLPLTMISLDLTHEVRAEDARIERLTAIETDHARLTVKLLRAANDLESRWKEGLKAPMHDPSTIAYLLRPALFQSVQARISVRTDKRTDFGQTVVSRGAGPHTWVTTTEAGGFFELLEHIVSAS